MPKSVSGGPRATDSATGLNSDSLVRFLNRTQAMDAHSRWHRPAYADENAVLPSKQPSAATAPASAVDDAAPRRERAALQPLAENIVRPASHTASQSAASQAAALLAPSAPRKSTSGSFGAVRSGEPALAPSLAPAPTSESSNVTESSVAVDSRPGGTPGSDATIDDDFHDTMDDEFDDALLRDNDHSHTASFADDESDEFDEVRLRLQLQQQPVAPSNPHALFPVETVHSRLVLDKCAQLVASTPGLLDAEDEDMWDASMVLEYAEDIFRHMRVMELRLLPHKGYMEMQKELDWEKRNTLVDWLVRVHFRFNLLPETLFLCVNYIDRFMSVREVSLLKFQLVGAVALFIAAKFEEINYLSVQEVCHMLENTCPVEEILRAERFMIDMLDFNLGFPGPMSFLRRVSKADDYDLETRTLAKYLLELTIMDERFVAAPPSWTAAIAHYMARHMLRQGPWTPRHVYFSNYTEEQLAPGVAAVREAIENPAKHHPAVYEKYSERKFRKAAVFTENWVKLVREHPDADFAIL